MQRLEVTTALLSPTQRSNEASRRASIQREREHMRAEDIELDDEYDEERFLTTLQEKLLERMDFLDHSFLVLRAKQINYAAIRLHEALEPKRDEDTQLIQAWTIQPQRHRQIKMSTHIQVLKLSTIFREVQCLRLHQQSGLRTAIEIEIFPSLRSIEVLQTQITALRHVHFFARQLRFLHVEQTDMDALQQILSPQSQTHKTAPVVWHKLERLQINCCALLAVDASVNQLPAIKHLDLGWNCITSFDAPLETSSLQVLHLCHNKLRAVPPIERLRHLRELDLSVNKITSLRGLESLVSLEALDVSHNSVASMADVERLVRLPRLRRLVLQHNPIARRPDYRREVLFYLGEHIDLDKQAWSTAELVSMKQSRQLLPSPHDRQSSESSWGDAPVLRVSSVSLGAIKSSASASENAEKFVLTYPVLPASRSSLTPHVVEIRRAPSALSPRYRQQQHQSSFSASSEFGASRTASSSHLSTADDSSELSPFSIVGDAIDDHGAAGHALFRTVDDFFTTQSDFIVVLDTDLVDARVEHTDSSDDDSDDSTSETGRRSRKYTTSDFMRDFEEEELLLRDGAPSVDVSAPLSRSVSAGARTKQTAGDGTMSVRVLLSADEASRYDLLFGIDGVAATLDVKPHEIIESIRPSDRETPLRIHRALADVIAIGSSIHSSRAKIVTLKLRMPANSLLDVTYQIDSASVLERVLAAVIAHLHASSPQKATAPVVCVCAHCGAVSHLSREYTLHFAPATALSSGASDPFVLYACLLCTSFNVREVSFEKMVAVYNTDGVALSAKRMAPAPALDRHASDGFYIEEHEIDASDALHMYECVLISSNGVREVTGPTADHQALDDTRNNAREEAIVQAISMQ